MQIAWDLFTPGRSLVGGLLIGLAAALYLWGTGRIAGIASLLAGPLAALWDGSSLRAQRPRLLFLLGLLLAPWAWSHVAALPPAMVDVGWPGLVSNNGYLSIVGNSANPDYIGQELNQIFLAAPSAE